MNKEIDDSVPGSGFFEVSVAELLTSSASAGSSGGAAIAVTLIIYQILHRIFIMDVGKTHEAVHRYPGKV